MIEVKIIIRHIGNIFNASILERPAIVGKALVAVFSAQPRLEPSLLILRKQG